MKRRTFRHPLRGDRVYVRSATDRRGRNGGWRRAERKAPRMPRMRRRRSVNVAALVASPEEVPSRPLLRLRIIGVVVVALFAVMVLRLWSLQVIDRRSYAAAVTANLARTVTVPAPRGLIVDRHDTVLVGDAVQSQIVLSRVAAKSDPGIVAKVAALVGATPKAVKSALTDQQYSPYEPVPILVNAPPATVQYLDAHQSEFPGVSVEQTTVRSYPQGGTTATQLLGYVGAINAAELNAHPHQGYTQSSQIGKTGVEQQYESYLRGSTGTKTLEVDAQGNVVGTLEKKSPTQGDTLVLNLTAGLQREVQTALATDIANDRTRHTPIANVTPAAPNGAAVVLDAKTGAVLASASYPTYGLTEWVGGISTAQYRALTAGCTTANGGCPLNNYVIQGLYTPGSTFKLATATAALQDGLITPSTTVDDTGVYHLPTCHGICTYHDATAYDAGVVNVTSAITKSDDYFFYTMGYRFYMGSAYNGSNRFGTTAIQDVAHQYGFGEPTGIDLPNEISGRVDSKPEREKLHQATPKGFPNTYWYVGTNLEMAFGQGETVLTPIEEAQAYATFADGGVRHQPEVANAVVSPSGKVVETIQPKVTGHLTISPTDYQAMLRGFIGVTHTPTGTAYSTFQQYSHVPSTYVIAGKTGTATTSTGSHVAPNAWFVGFGPTGTTHQYVVAVVVSQAGYGSIGAAPAVANIFNYLYANPPAASPTLPTATAQPSTSLPPANPPAGTPTTTTTTAPATTTTTAPGTTTTQTTAPRPASGAAAGTSARTAAATWGVTAGVAPGRGPGTVVAGVPP